MFTGIMSACPAYLGLTIFDGGAGLRPATEQIEGQTSAVLVRSDLLIFCPSNFSVEVRLERPPAAVAVSSADVKKLRSIVVGLADAGSSPFYVRLTRASSSVTARGQVNNDDDDVSTTGAPRRSSAVLNTSHGGDHVADFTNGNILIAVAITGALFIVVYVGQHTARATTTRSPGTPLSLVSVLLVMGFPIKLQYNCSKITGHGRRRIRLQKLTEKVVI